MQETRIKFVAIIVITLAFGYLVAPMPDKWLPGFLDGAKIQLGIDLGGGGELTYRLLYDKDFSGNRDAALQSVVSVLEKRINTRGLKEPRITSRGDDLVVIQLAGVDKKGLEGYKELISKVGKLELKEVADRVVHEKYLQTKVVPDGYELKRPPKEGDPSRSWIKEYVLVKRDPIITGEGDSIKKVEHRMSFRSGGSDWSVHFTLGTQAAKQFDDAAGRLYQQEPKGLLAIMIDGQIQSMPFVNSPSFDGSVEVQHIGSQQEAQNLEIVLKSGSLPVPIGRIEGEGAALKQIPREPEASTFVGPSLGQDSIFRGLIASAVSFIGIAIFMMVYYRAGGIIATITLVINLVWLLGIMSFFGATLTLPGIAGIVLTAGMAVDANILIYERMREELAKGKTLPQAFEAGHDRAFVTIMDSNITTLLAAVVLYFFGTGPVQGFAVTLSIGIMTTLASVLFCGNVFLKMLIAGGSIKEMRMMKIMASPNYNFVKYLRPAVFASVLLIAGSMAVFFVRGEKNFGIDFRGGSVLRFAFAEPQNIDQVRAGLQEIKDPETKLPRYPDAEVTTEADPGRDITDIKLVQSQSRHFQVRARTQNVNQLRKDILEQFKDKLWPAPMDPIRPPSPEIPAQDRYLPSGAKAGAGWTIHFVADNGLVKVNEAGTLVTQKELEERLKEGLRGIVSTDPNSEKPDIRIQQAPNAPKGYVKVQLFISEKDYAEAMPARPGDRTQDTDRLIAVGNAVEKMAEKKTFTLSGDAILAEDNIGPTAAHELKNKGIWAMIVSWILMIAYIAIRFSSWRFGVAAVAALVHDALISIGVVSVLGMLIPASWGLSFDMNMTFVAAVLTIIGFSINDTIVIFDRIRENLQLMKKESFAEIINTSVNQTLSRTILTSLTVWITTIILYVSTMTSGGGIAEFSLPLIIGVLAGTYSTVYVASAIVVWWYGKNKPQLA